MSQSGIKAVIRVRVNSVARSMGCPSRRDAVLEGRRAPGLGLGAGCIVLVLGGSLRAFSLL